MRKLKLIWDFRGADAHKIAEHHVIHLKEYNAIHTIAVYEIDVEDVHKLHTMAYMVIDEADMKPIRDALKPHRGQVYETE